MLSEQLSLALSPEVRRVLRLINAGNQAVMALQALAAAHPDDPLAAVADEIAAEWSRSCADAIAAHAPYAEKVSRDG
jgi:hypothetical protein